MCAFGAGDAFVFLPVWQQVYAIAVNNVHGYPAHPTTYHQFNKVWLGSEEESSGKMIFPEPHRVFVGGDEESVIMSMPEPGTLSKPEIARKMVRVEVEVPEDAIESLRAYAASLRGEPLPKAKDFKEFLTAAPGDDEFWDDVATSRDKRPARAINL